MAIDHDPTGANELAYNERIIESIIRAKAEEYLQELVMEQIKPHIKGMAVEAVKQWIQVRSSIEHSAADPLYMNYNIQFVEKVVQKIENITNITIKERT